MQTLRAGFCAALLFTVGCGAETLGPAAVILLTNTWHEEGDDAHTFGILDDTGGEARDHGAFTGNETLDGVEYPLSGSWSDSRVELLLSRVPGVTWRATIRPSNTNRLEFTSSQGSLVIVRN